MTSTTDDDSDIHARNLVIAVSRAVRLSLLHRLENDAIATTAAGLSSAVDAALQKAGGAVVRCSADGVFVNGQLVRPIGEVVESAERLQKHLVRLGVETLAFSSVPTDEGVRLLLQAFQQCAPGNATPLLTLAVPGIVAKKTGEGGGGGAADARSVVVGGVVDVCCACSDLRSGRSRRAAPLRRALQRLWESLQQGADGGAEGGAEGGAALIGALTGVDDDDASRGAAVGCLVLLCAQRAGRPPKEAVFLAFTAALAVPHKTLDDVVAASTLPTAQAPAICALRLALWQSAQSPATGFAGLVLAAEVCAVALLRGKSWAVVHASLEQAKARFSSTDAAAVLSLAA